MIMNNKILQELEKWSQKYEISFQFWPEQKNVFISKDGVELTSFGGYNTIEDVIFKALNYVYKINKTPINNRISKQSDVNYCQCSQQDDNVLNYHDYLKERYKEVYYEMISSPINIQLYAEYYYKSKIKKVINNLLVDAKEQGFDKNDFYGALIEFI